MSDEQESALGADQSVVTEPQEGEGQVEDQTAEGQTEVEETEAESEDEKKRKNSAKERRDREKAYRQRLRDDADSANSRAVEAERRRDAILQAGKQGNEPQRGQFQDPAEYAAARAVWQYRQQQTDQIAGEAHSAAEQARNQAAQYEQAERQVAHQQWTEQVVEARSRYSDFDEVALAKDLPISESVADIIRSSDAAADLAYWLGKNRAEAMRISQMQPIAAARDLGRIEASLAAPQPRKQSSAPPPITPGKASASGGKQPDKMSPDEYRAWRESGGKF